MLIRAGHSLASQCNPISHSGDLVQSVVVDVYFSVLLEGKGSSQVKSKSKQQNGGKNNCKREKCEVLKDEKQLTDSVKKQRLQQHQQLYNSTALRLCWIKSALPETAHTICTIVCCPCACHERKERKKETGKGTIKMLSQQQQPTETAAADARFLKGHQKQSLSPAPDCLSWCQLADSKAGKGKTLK